MNEPTVADLTPAELEEAVRIVLDLAHAGGPSPCASLTRTTRDRAERWVQAQYERRLKLD